MDPQKSIQTGVDIIGRPVYDTIPMIVNNFLKIAPLNDEDKVFTYIVLEDDGFDHLYNKYRKYFECGDDQASDSITKFNVCQDFVFNGIIDIENAGDTITNIFGVKVPVKDINITSPPHEASNGRIYVIDKSNILLKEKFKPIIIEGENFTRSTDNSVIFIRYKPLWASGGYDMVLSCNANQTDTFLWYPPMPSKLDESLDSVYTRTRRFHAIGDDGSNNKVIANTTNFFVEYKAPVNSVEYEIRYVAYNDISSENRLMTNQYHINVPIDNPPFPEKNEVQTFRLEQKLFISMPGNTLRKEGDRIVNNFENGICFVSVDTAGIYKERTMMKWRYDNSPDRNTQYILQPLNEPDANILKVTQTGELTLWLCNTTRTNATAGGTLLGAQGMLFLDYIKLTPVMKEE
jgi:hypothetical protein